MSQNADIFGNPTIDRVKKRPTNKKSNKRIVENNKIKIGTKLGLSKKHIKILKNSQQENSAKELMKILGFTNLTKFRTKYLNILLDEYKEAVRDVNGKVVKKPKIDKSGNRVIKGVKSINGNILEEYALEIVYTTKKGHGFFKMSKPEKPNARDQRYISTGKFVQIKDS